MNDHSFFYEMSWKRKLATVSWKASKPVACEV